MAFKIPKEEYVNRTFRFEKSLLDRMDKICDKEKKADHGDYSSRNK